MATWSPGRASDTCEYMQVCEPPCTPVVRQDVLLDHIHVQNLLALWMRMRSRPVPEVGSLAISRHIHIIFKGMLKNKVDMCPSLNLMYSMFDSSDVK